MFLVLLSARKLHPLLIAWVSCKEIPRPLAIAFAAHPRAFRVHVNIIVGQFVAPLAMGLVFVPALAIYLNCHGFQVLRVAAMTNLAEVVNFLTVRDRADMIFI